MSFPKNLTTHFVARIVLAAMLPRGAGEGNPNEKPDDQISSTRTPASIRFASFFDPLERFIGSRPYLNMHSWESRSTDPAWVFFHPLIRPEQNF